MLFIKRPETDPYFNLAAEEYIFHNYKEDVIMLWRNTPAVIIGKHQNPYREVNIAFARDHQLPVIRRISGGGTVYHDIVNLNFTFIRSAPSKDRVNYKAFLQPLISILNRWAIPCELAGKSDLMVNHRKISGNSQHVFKNRVLHHGTLLYSSSLENLNVVLTNRSTRYSDKSIRSNPAPVANISEYLKNPPPIEVFSDQLALEIMMAFSPVASIPLNLKDEEAILTLAEKKFRTWEWNFGYSPPYNLHTHLLQNGKEIEIEISVRNGVVQKINIFGAPQTARWFNLFTGMEGLRHEEHTIKHYLDANPDLTSGLGMSPNEIIQVLF